MKTSNGVFVLLHMFEGHGTVVVEIRKVLHGRIFLGLRISRQTLSENLWAGVGKMLSISYLGESLEQGKLELIPCTELEGIHRMAQ